MARILGQGMCLMMSMMMMTDYLILITDTGTDIWVSFVRV
jgi:hypothetical protein